MKATTSSATGRVVGIALSDGNYVRYLHLQSIVVAVGQQVTQGQLLGYSGASANGSEGGVGAHVHTSMWLNTGNPGSMISNTVDFELYVGGAAVPSDPPPAPIGIDDDMAFLCITPINGTNANAGIYRWLMDPSAGTKRNIDAAEYDFLKAVGYKELSGLQSPAVSQRYALIQPAPTSP